MRFGRRKSQQPADPDVEASLAAALDAIERGDLPAFDDGPYDFRAESERHGFVYLPDHLDVESLLLPPTGAIEPSLRGDAATGTVESVVLTQGDDELEISVFSAADAAQLVAEARRQAVEEIQEQGGTGTEQVGPFGPELHCVVPVVTDAGEAAAWRARIVIVQGPDWYLQAMFQESLADDADAARPFEDILRRVFVRSDGSIPTGERLPLSAPAG